MEPKVTEKAVSSFQAPALDPKECAERLRFETVLADLSARFVNVSSNRLDAEISEAQRRVCECLGLHLSALWQWEPVNPDVLVMTHLHRPPDSPPIPERIRANDYFPWILHELESREVVILSSIEDLPEAAARDWESLFQFGVKAGLSIRLSVGGNVPFGVLTFSDMQSEREWTESLVKRLALVAQVFANALVRQRSEQALRESEEKLALSTEAAEAGPWVLNIEKECFWVGPKIMEIFGLPPGETLGVERFFTAVHPEDRERVRETVRRAAASEHLTTVEYRIVRPDGAIRWLTSRGRLTTGGPSGLTRLTGLTVDVTELKKKEEALRASEARVAAAMDVAGLGFYETGEDSSVVFLDERIRDILGIPPDKEAQGREYWLAHIHPDDQSGLADMSRQIRDGKITRGDEEYRYMHPTRGLLWLHHLVRVLERNADRHSIRTVGVFRDITERKQVEESLRQALGEVQNLRDRLELENVVLREQLRRDDNHDELVGESELILKMLDQAKKVAPTDSAVLILGETGTGKELLAQAIHDMSSRSGKPMVKVNCAALPSSLIEGELFGREKGAYTGAMTRQIGRFEVADGSTIFLDEIGDLPLELQVKLLRVLQDGQFERLGSNVTLKADVRLIAATNHDLDAMVREGRFREDLFHRLNVFPIESPPLRSRGADIPILVWAFLEEFNHKMGKAIDSIPKTLMERLKQYDWPGNVRELRNLVERAVIVSEGSTLHVELPASGQHAKVMPDPLEEVERQHITDVLEHTRWRVSGKGGAAEILGLVPTTLHSRMKKLGISRPRS